ncbi:hypothetical protein [Saccharothrix luteola]|uniref:hypothetical protein n=1 Tax=Saccharothrix luteola TaxID=2893018 RepID=UPI001E4654DF|nr:hypothetical protein [Saccharothrix luteola]MCC8242689.1 hypothetical protein [Saccharothrix luteola]
MKKIDVRALFGAVLVALIMLGTSGIASASDQQWSASSGGVVRVSANFDDAANRVYVHDALTDNGYARMDIWRVGNIGGTHVICRAGSDGEGGLPKNANCPLIWVEDTHLKGELCWHNDSLGNRACSAIKEFHS